MTIETTLALIKPDGVLMGNAEKIQKVYENAGLTVTECCTVVFSREKASEFYRDHAGKNFFTGLILSLSSDKCRILILEGENAISKVRELNGATKPDEAKPGEIRHDFKSAGGPFNTVHGSDSVESFLHEFRVVNSLPAVD